MYSKQGSPQTKIGNRILTNISGIHYFKVKKKEIKKSKNSILFIRSFYEFPCQHVFQKRIHYWENFFSSIVLFSTSIQGEEFKPVRYKNEEILTFTKHFLLNHRNLVAFLSLTANTIYKKTFSMSARSCLAECQNKLQVSPNTTVFHCVIC